VALALGFAAVVATLLGGLFALRYQDKLHLILGFSAGAVLGVALFDLLPEAFSLAGKHYATATVTLFVAFGFFTFMFLNRVLLLHPEDEEHAVHEPQASRCTASSTASRSGSPSRSRPPSARSSPQPCWRTTSRTESTPSP